MIDIKLSSYLDRWIEYKQKDRYGMNDRSKKINKQGTVEDMNTLALQSRRKGKM